MWLRIPVAPDPDRNYERVLSPGGRPNVLEDMYKEEELGTAAKRLKAYIPTSSDDPTRNWYRNCSMKDGIRGKNTSQPESNQTSSRTSVNLKVNARITNATTNDSQLTAFRNEGAGIQFAGIALKVYQEAKRTNLG
jgi:hypothetical protein